MPSSSYAMPSGFKELSTSFFGDFSCNRESLFPSLVPKPPQYISARNSVIVGISLSWDW